MREAQLELSTDADQRASSALALLRSGRLYPSADATQAHATERISEQFAGTLMMAVIITCRPILSVTLALVVVFDRRSLLILGHDGLHR
jgi:hypothetical protein